MTKLPADAKVELVRLLRLFEAAYSSSRGGMPWIGTVRPEQVFAMAADEIERLRAALEQSDAEQGEDAERCDWCNFPLPAHSRACQVWHARRNMKPPTGTAHTPQVDKG